MIQFTDLHLDLLYEENASSVCDDVICCRATDGFPTNKSLQAGKYGTFGCDIPMVTFTAMGEFIQ